MSYCVEYNPELRKDYPMRTKQKRQLPIKLILSISLIAAVYILASCGIFRHLIPGDPDKTTAAFSVMVEEIGEGERLKDAVVTFCREVITNAPQ